MAPGKPQSVKWSFIVRFLLRVRHKSQKTCLLSDFLALWHFKGHEVNPFRSIKCFLGPCIPQNRLPCPEPIVPISNNSFSGSQNESIFLKLEPVSSENSSVMFQTPKNRQVLSQISVNRLEPRNSKFKNDEEKENVSPIIFADSDKTPTMPFRKRILGESNLNCNRSPKNGLFEIKSRSPPKSQDSGNKEQFY